MKNTQFSRRWHLLRGESLWKVVVYIKMFSRVSTTMLESDFLRFRDSAKNISRFVEKTEFQPFQTFHCHFCLLPRMVIKTGLEACLDVIYGLKEKKTACLYDNSCYTCKTSKGEGERKGRGGRSRQQTARDTLAREKAVFDTVCNCALTECALTAH